MSLAPPNRSGASRGRFSRSIGAAKTALKRGIAFTVAATLAILILTSTLPPLLADQSDRAVVNAPVMLLTSPIDGEVKALTATPALRLSANSLVAEISNVRMDRTTLITLESRQSDASDHLRSLGAERDSDEAYLRAITDEIARESAIVVVRYQQQITDLEAQVASAGAGAEEKRQIVGRQTAMVARDVFSPEMAKAATQQFNAAKFQQDSAQSKLQQKQAQLDSARKNIFVGDDVHDLAAMIQRRRDMALEVQRLRIEQIKVVAEVATQTRLVEAETRRLASLEHADVKAPGRGEIVNVGATIGRHVSAGDTLARMVDCDASFVVAIFSYRHGADLTVGSRVSIDAGLNGTQGGTILEVLPKTSDKVDENYAVPFPQTERRELYVLVRPDSPLRSLVGTTPGQCGIGQWVTVTQGDGWIPSSSVLWRVARQAVTNVAHRAVTASAKVLSVDWTSVAAIVRPSAADAQTRPQR